MKPPYHNLLTPYTQLHPEHCALLIVDTQNDFGDAEGVYPLPDFENVLPQLREAIDIFRRTGKLIVHVVRLYEANGSNVDLCRKWGFEQGALSFGIVGTWGAELVASTNPTGAALDTDRLLAGDIQELTPLEFVIYKPRFNSFHSTPLKAFLDTKGIDSLVIVGFTFPNCVLATQIGATDFDYRVGLVPSACTEINEDGLMAMQNKGVQLMTVDDLRSLLDNK